MRVVIEYTPDNGDLARIYRLLLAREGATVILSRVPGYGILRFRVNGGGPEAVLDREDYYAVMELLRAIRGVAEG